MVGIDFGVCRLSVHPIQRQEVPRSDSEDETTFRQTTQGAATAHKVSDEQPQTDINKRHTMIFAIVYSKGYPYEETTEVQEFDSLELMTEFVNKTLGELGKEEKFKIFAAYQVYKKVEYEKVEVVTRLKPKES